MEGSIVGSDDDDMCVLDFLDFEEKLEEEDDEDFCSCCTDDTDTDTDTDTDEEVVLVNGSSSKHNLAAVEENCLKMFFKGVSIPERPGSETGSGLSGIGVMTDKSAAGVPVIQVQKKLHFYVDELVAEYLALMDALLEALTNNVPRVLAFTDNNLLYHQIAGKEALDNELLMALRERIMEHASKFECFAVKIVPSNKLQRPLQLARIAIGIVCLSAEEDGLVEECPICCEEKPHSMMINVKCSHKFCSYCMRTYVEGKLQTFQVPIRCPQLRCKYFISATECRSFLPVASYNLLEKALVEGNFLDSEKVYCPFPSCSVLLNPLQCLSNRASSSSNADINCLECPDCQRLICLDCGVPWHSSMSCEEYQSLPIEERDASDITLHRLAQNKKWRRCQQCRRMIELTQGCYHMTCWCGHEFCYSCGAEYGDGQQTCQCAFWDDENIEVPVTQFNHNPGQWGWDSLDPIPTIMDAYSNQERSQLALIQRFLAGGFDLSDHQPYQSPPRCADSYIDTIKELHQLPWLERFVSVISDNYYEDYTQ